MNLRQLLGNVTLANQLTFLRLVAVPFFILSVLGARFGLALGLFVAAAVTDLLDGLTARMLRQGTPLGTFLDPAADKILMVTAFVLLTDYPTMFQQIPMTNRLPVTLTILAICRDVFIVVTALALYLAYGMGRFVPTIWGKLTTVAEVLTIGVLLLLNALGRTHPIFDVAIWTTLALILFSGFHYLWRTVGLMRATESPAGPES